MLSYIVPPVIIVVSLAILIVFLFKKFSREANLDQSAIEGLNASAASAGIVSMFFSSINRMWFRGLEKMMQRTKLFSLKMHNASNGWFHSLKNKREKNSQMENHVKDNRKVKDEIAKDIEEVVGIVRKVDVVKKPVESIKKKRKFLVRKPIIEREEVKDDAQVVAEIKTRRRGFFSRKNKVDIVEKVIEEDGTEEGLIKKIAVDPKDSIAYEKLGDYYSEINNYRDSIECYKQVLKLSPEKNTVRMKIRSLEVIMKK